ncbi:MAG: hypothetical protein QF596_01530 [Acidimicrobiales bacterium]|nr:hypothetical protein [Acidimicrobiales bacterium]MDP6298918.1 hypothetical protein [Acidimicrobiales bacterium]HJM27877.1 hypothetical protein [Acidimicrobiales bacterium]HJM98436.1 hypothetical protein [Acidimicrobiales bacterium]
MASKLLERRLIETGQRLKQLRADLQVAEEQLSHFSDDADDARIKSLVSETPLAGKELREASKHAESMRRHRNSLLREILKVETLQDELLDQMAAEK